MTCGNPDQPSAVIPVLGYARTVTHHGVTIERGRGTARVTMPATHLRRAMVWWAVGTMWMGSQPVARLYMGEGSWGEVVMAVVLSIAALAVVLRSRRWRGLIVVTPEWVRVGQRRFRGVKWQFSWRRESVGEIRYNPYMEQLLFRINGWGIVDVPVPGDEQTMQEIGQALGEALMESAESSAGE